MLLFLVNTGGKIQPVSNFRVTRSYTSLLFLCTLDECMDTEDPMELISLTFTLTKNCAFLSFGPAWTGFPTKPALVIVTYCPRCSMDSK